MNSHNKISMIIEKSGSFIANGFIVILKISLYKDNR